MKSESKTYCINCGTLHKELTFPKKCLNPKCGHEMFKNPIPVVVVILPVEDYGVLVGKRAISPKLGHWALPGGYVDEGESYEDAARREIFEETGLDYQGSFKIIGIESPEDIQKANMIIMLQAENPIPRHEVKYEPTSEMSELKVITEPEELAFPVHQDYLNNYFKNY